MINKNILQKKLYWITSTMIGNNALPITGLNPQVGYSTAQPHRCFVSNTPRTIFREQFGRFILALLPKLTVINNTVVQCLSSNEKNNITDRKLRYRTKYLKCCHL